MNLFIYTGASRLNAAVVESATDLTPVSRLPDLIVGDSEPVTVKFLSASGAYESWSGGGTYTLSISIGALGGDGIAAYFQTSSFTTVTNGWTGRLNLASGSLPSVVAGYLAERPGAQSVPLFVQVRVTDADGNTETYARQAVSISGAVSVPTTANSTPVTYATAADVAADASTASAAAIAAAASASTAAGSASTAAGHVTTAGNSATAAAASAVTAGNSATTASGHATTATTQATNAATSASSAGTYKDAAAVSAASATSSAGTATTQAALATTNGAAQVTLAAAQVTLATTQATNAGTSASAAAVSAAAALVSEAAALVSKNAAAASAATASAVSGSGNGTFSAAALTGVNSITASASTALTLTGGSTGASLVLGQGVNAITTITPTNSGWAQINADAGLKIKRAASDELIQIFGGTTFGISVTKTTGTFRPLALYTSDTEVARLTTTGNLLIGTTTDMTGSAGLKIAGTTAATTTTSGALIVAGGVGVSGAGYFGGAVSASGSGTIGGVFNGAGSGSTNNVAIGTSGGGSVFVQGYNAAFSTGQTLGLNAVAGGAVNVGNGATVTTINGTTSASSSTVGALTIGNGTAATNVAIGAGAINAGGTLTAGGSIIAGGTATGLSHLSLVSAYGTTPAFALYKSNGSANAKIWDFGAGISSGDSLSFRVVNDAVNSASDWLTVSRSGTTVTGSAFGGTSNNVSIAATTPSTGSTSGALQVAGGIYAGAASVLAGPLTVGGTGSWINLLNSASGGGQILSDAVQGVTHLTSNAQYTGSQWNRVQIGHAAWRTALDSAGDQFVIYRSASGANPISWGSPLLTIASTGAATFAGAVTTNGQTSLDTAGAVSRALIVGPVAQSGGNLPYASIKTSIADFGLAVENTNAVSGQGLGLRIVAGATASDLPLYVRDRTNATTLFSVGGTGAATFAGAVTVGSSGGITSAGNLTLQTATDSRINFIANQTAWLNYNLAADRWTFRHTTSGVTSLTLTEAAATFAAVVIKKNYTVATLPAAASYTYGEAYVSDATQAAGTSLGSAPTGGGSVKRGVYSDGSSWLLR